MVRRVAGLTAAQKKVLDQYDIPGVEQLPASVYHRLELMHDFETIYQRVDMYLYDRWMDRKLNRRPTKVVRSGTRRR